MELLSSPGWAVLCNLVQPLIQERLDYILMHPLKSMDDALGQEYLKGEAGGWKFMLELPRQEVESAEAIVDLFKKQRLEERDIDG